MKRSAYFAPAVCLLVAACFSGCQQSASSSEAPAVATSDKKPDGAKRFERDGWIYVHLEGAPDRIGYQHGSLLSKEIEDLLRVMKPFLERQSKRDWNFYRESAEKMLWPKMDREYQDEIDGIVAGATAKGVKLDRYDVVAMNAFIELAQYYVPWMEKQKGLQASTKAPGNCSAFVATGSWTKDGRIVMGHNAWTDYVIGSRWNIIFDIKPEKGHRMLMDGLPGVIASMDDFGVNESGIMITETTITGFTGFDPKGKPEFERARKAMQYSDSIDDYARIMLEGNNGGYANDWLIGDNKTGEIALFELGLKEHSLRRTKDGFFVGSNFPVDEKLMKAETNFDPNNKASSPNARRARWEQLMAEYKGRIDVDAAKKFETDGFDAFAKKQGANERSLCGSVESSPRGVPEWDWPAYFPGGTVQAKVMDARMAEKMQLWGSYGHACAPDFIAEDFLKRRKEYEWARGLLRDMKTGDWALFEISR
jgi:phospholipase B-like protein